jgi:glutamine synthetase
MPFLNDVRIASELQGVPLTTLHGEFSPGQWEINTLHQADAVVAGTHALLLRRIVKGVARKHGYGATFMAKPFGELAGSGMHIHASVYDKDGSNVFADPDPVEPPRLMPRLRHAVGGLGQLLDESMLCFAPHANSYRRFKAGALAPSGKSWGYDHREVALRIPRSTEHNRRIEHRVAGAEANPYLVLAAVLAGIHHGLQPLSTPESRCRGMLTCRKTRRHCPHVLIKQLNCLPAATLYKAISVKSSRESIPPSDKARAMPITPRSQI